MHFTIQNASQAWMDAQYRFIYIFRSSYLLYINDMCNTMYIICVPLYIWAFTQFSKSSLLLCLREPSFYGTFTITKQLFFRCGPKCNTTFGTMLVVSFAAHRTDVFRFVFVVLPPRVVTLISQRYILLSLYIHVKVGSFRSSRSKYIKFIHIYISDAACIVRI